jgi:Reversibly glycosylated polypeptide
MKLPKPSDQTQSHQNEPSVAVVIPMPNDPPWSLFDEIPAHIPIIVADDSDGRLEIPERENVFFFDYAAQKEYCGAHYDAMPHKSAASRNVGHYIAYQEGFDVIIALDYDCRTRRNWFTTHLKHLSDVADYPASTPSQPGGWINSIGCEGFFARGYPYELRSSELSLECEVTTTGTVKLNMGVWDNILDLNGIDKLQTAPPAEPMVNATNRVALGPLPLCGMNTAFRAELTPAYFFLPDLWVDGWQLSRHDDIWGGYILEALMQCRGDMYTYGHPIVEHTRQTPLERVVVMEHWMHLMSMGFYDVVDDAMSNIRADDYTTMYANFVDEYLRAVDRSTRPSHYKTIYKELGNWMTRWSKAFQ